MESYAKFCCLVIFISFSVFQALFNWVSPPLSRLFCPAFASLTPAKQIEWHSRTVSTLHALIVGFFCLYILWFDDAVNKDPVWGDPKIVQLNIAITTGYLFSDFLLIVCNWNAIGDKFFIMHHLSALYAYYYVMDRGVLPYFANFRQLAELSTPFVNQRESRGQLRRPPAGPGPVASFKFLKRSRREQRNCWEATMRWFYEALGYPKAGGPYVVNGVLMAVAFFAVRVAVMPPYYGRMLATVGTEAFARLGTGPQVSWVLSSVCLDVMNVMWMYKIARGCYKVLFVRSQGRPVTNGKSQ
ncbi:TLC domain-containing protein 4-B-like isoform X1 [Lethenteron reissneri]|uniref:TLC domain-containing protein 4-B-like isoform X1 n=1 Tax=Lethenteron reissneri TaxID=7753 RepID=UPI002AB7681C|nr:TLC domain-containing protein 4-B-like isoform X1 [Lethenteron reissneri]XP_061423676.1 TLC domain-containing protein 4-B-like isoform X1 [Lethenteron reissneri]XP_061423677.1 TLC domain-containing protein 4-B-like isoform X1 [Lethenteron reissneri]XP_061423678.1 TLC domain-containing protein 4-B-like isoform X1 [Lethenteron reissneri]XP_061423679.1 TLC domain-containing protein 4-B-like isoform X1 [Lethenteron reissneri]XP_061423680.1 TLC domain-containing protein 4-B-like isoform X1 [Leth